MAGMITINAIMTAISGMVLGPDSSNCECSRWYCLHDSVSLRLFSGPLVFLTVTMGGLVAGLLMANKWVLAAILMHVIIGSWFETHILADWYVDGTVLPYSAVALLVIVINHFAIG
jgi:hypothetical protein